MRTTAVLVSLVLLLASCGDGDPSDQADATGSSTTESVTPSSAPATSSPTVSTTSTASPLVPMDVDVTRDVRYGDDREGFHPALLDVFAPADRGPWPLVMMFHGGGGQFQDKAVVEPIARVVASKGAVVVAPNTGGPSANPNARDFRILTDGAATCATWFALEQAPNFDADPEDLTLSGFSGGANAASLLALAPDASGLDVEFCQVSPRSVAADSVVAWEGDYALAPWWDDTLEANPGFYGERWIWGRIDTSSDDVIWHLVLGPPDRVGVERLPVNDPFGEGDECARPLAAGEEGVAAAGGMCRYFDLRDPSGDLRMAADRLGLFDDGWLTIGEFTLLFADQLEAAGLTTTVTVVDDATHSDLTPEGAETFADLIVGT